MEVVELLYVFEAYINFLNRSGNPATGSRQHLEKIQCIFSSDFFYLWESSSEQIANVEPVLQP